jgi:hypothetical protein
VLWFHDTTFEAIAESLRVEAHTCPMRELLVEAALRLVD